VEEEPRQTRAEGFAIALVGKKTNLALQCTVALEAGDAKARAIGAAFFEVSAQLGAGVDELFVGIMQMAGGNVR
jgi:hypothetical protein